MPQTSAGIGSGVGFWLLLGAGTAFIWSSSASLPPVVASHFGPGGIANGFTPQPAYRAALLLIGIGVPLLLFVLPGLLAHLPDQLINLPNRDYWLAPDRRAASLGFFREHSRYFAAFLLMFLCYAHWLVVRANRLSPPHLSESAMLAGLAAFLLFTVAWIWALWRRFRLP